MPRLALSVVPMLIAYVAKRDPTFVERICVAWLLGICVSSLVAVTELLGATFFGSISMPVEGGAARFPGLTSHPNHLGASVAMAAPLAVWLFSRRYGAGFVVILLLAGGATASGSRGGEAGFVIALGSAIFLLERSRRLWVVVVLVAFTSVAGALWTRSGAVESGAALIRFNSSAVGTEESNEERLALARQGLSDFLERPINGVGLGVVASAHDIYLQWLASGGIVLALTMVWYFSGALKSAIAEGRSVHPLGLYLSIVISVWLLLGLVENQLTDRYLYFPVGCIAGLQGARLFGARTDATRSALLRRQSFLRFRAKRFL